MAQWKFRRQKFGTEEYTLLDGENVTIGRGCNNTITLPSLLISRNHCLLSVKKSKVLITDLKSSNGIFVGTEKIPQNIPYAIRDSDVIGFGLTIHSSFPNVNDNEKYIFKLVREEQFTPLSNRIVFQSENEYDDLEEKVKTLDSNGVISTSPVIDNKLSLKRKMGISEAENIQVKNAKLAQNHSPKHKNLKSPENCTKTKIFEPCLDNLQNPEVNQLNVKMENDFMELEAFNVKQEYLKYDDEPILIDSESDSESEHWFLRLSQNSPGKPFNKVSLQSENSKLNTYNEDSSYSQMDDDSGGMVMKYIIADDDNDEDFPVDLISIPPEPVIFEANRNALQDNAANEIFKANDLKDKEEVSLHANQVPCSENDSYKKTSSLSKDEVDGHDNISIENSEISLSVKEPISSGHLKKTQLITPPTQDPKRKKSEKSKIKSHQLSSKKDTTKKNSSKRSISNSQKEERKKKLKAIADKNREDLEQDVSSNNQTIINKTTVNIKMTNTNRGAFLSDVLQGVVEPIKRIESPQKAKIIDTKIISSTVTKLHENKHDTPSTSKEEVQKEELKQEQKIESKSKHRSGKHNSSKHKSSKHKSKNHEPETTTESRLPLKSLKPLTESQDSLSGKPFSKVEPLPQEKQKKKVRFSEAPPEVHVFEVEPGNKLKKTSSVKTSLLDVQHNMPMFSLEKITLMKILRWNPQWLDEQVNNKEPPPILGHQNPPMVLFQSFHSHNEYVQLVGDLLLMEIWECLSLAYKKMCGQNNAFRMSIASLPPVPTQERCYEIFNISVDVSMPTSDLRNLPKVGEILLVSFGAENMRSRRFFFVHNVRSLPSPPRNIHSYFNVSLHATFTDKMKLLTPGEVMVGVRLAHIQKELNLFSAMAHLAGSPLSKAILKPEPEDFEYKPTINPSRVE